MTALSEGTTPTAHSARLRPVTRFVSCGLLAVLLGWANWIGAAAQAKMQQARSMEIAQENISVCQKWGMAVGSTKITACVSDLNEVRRRHEERILQDAGIF
jgi:hypothetical protein